VDRGQAYKLTDQTLCKCMPKRLIHISYVGQANTTHFLWTKCRARPKRNGSVCTVISN